MRNFASQGLLSACPVVLPLLVYPYVTRMLQPDMLGRVTYATALVGYFSLISALGMPVYGMRECAARRGDRQGLAQVVAELTLMRVLTTLVSAAAFVGLVRFAPQLREEAALYHVAGTALLLQAAGGDCYFQLGTFGPEGAAAAAVAAELVVALMACVYARRVAPMRVVDKRTLAQAVAGAAAAGCAMMLAGRCAPASWGSLAQMATSALSFFGVYACCTALSRRAWRGLRRSGGTV